MVNGGKNKKPALSGGVSSLFLFVVVVAVAVGVAHGNNAGEKGSTPSKTIKALCQPVDYKETCEKALSEAGTESSDPREIIKAGFHIIVEQIKSAITSSKTLKEAAKEPMAKKAIDDCGELMDYAIDNLILSFDRMADEFDIEKINDYIEDIKVWLSGALTYQETCLDGFENVSGDSGEKMRKLLKISKEMTVNTLDMVDEVTSALSSFGFSMPSFERRLVSEESNEEEEPSWVNDRRGLLRQASPGNIKADAVVAQDGSGKYKTVTQALQAVPKSSNKTFVIYIKEGIYKEQVMVDKKMTHVMMIGDGPTKTRIVASENFIDGTPTFKTATVAVVGSNFMAKDMGFENAAGPSKHQAVALRVQSDMSVFFNCRMDGYQDTLYTHAQRQFYRDCTITGTIDFIFGNAAVVFQNCKIMVRKPMENQQCIVTAQGRTQKKEPTGIVLQNCVIMSDPEYFPVRFTNKAYLGRPWKEYSRTIIMQSQIDDLIQPEGWLPWNGDFALKTLFYSEFNNRGPGSNMDKRVKWRGIKQMTPKHAADFTAGLFIRGNPWIMPTRVPYSSGMMKV